MRGKGCCHHPVILVDGITPAYAGKSRARRTASSTSWDHPRVCREKYGRFDRRCSRAGSPPRVRGKEKHHPFLPEQHGITPACAGKSATLSRMVKYMWDHPRVCGEKSMSAVQTLDRMGSPPRVRGKASTALYIVVIVGITPACAGKSLRSRTVWRGLRDHPRVCGEKCQPRPRCPGWAGSPPRVRGKASFLAHL